jgi:hypothetical protein
MMHTTSYAARRVVLAIVVALSMAAAAGPAQAAKDDLSWIIERPTWLGSYLVSLEATVKSERAAGAILPPAATSGKLPVYAYSQVNNVDADVKLSIDITGVKEFYVSVFTRAILGDLVLVKANGDTLKLTSKTCVVTSEYKNVKPRYNFHIALDGGVKCDQAFKIVPDGKYAKLTVTMKRQVGDTSFICFTRTAAEAAKFATMQRRRYALRRYCSGMPAKITGKERRYYGRITQDTINCLPTGFTGLGPKALQRSADKLLAMLANRSIMKGEAAALADLKPLAATRIANLDQYHRVVMTAILMSERARRVSDLYGKYSGASQRGRYAIEGFDCREFADKFYRRLRDGRALAVSKIDPADGAGFKAFYTYLDKEADACDKRFFDIKLAKAFVVGAAQTVAYVDKVAPVSQADKKTVAALTGTIAAERSDGDKILQVFKKLKSIRRRILFTHPALAFERILINRNPPTSFSHNSDQHLGRHARFGPGLTVLTGWKTDNPKPVSILAGKLPAGATRNPDVHFDGKKVVFAFAPKLADPLKQRYFLYEAAIDGSQVRQLTGTGRDKFETSGRRATVIIEDNDPCYLPDGGIAFVSTRCQSFGRCHAGRYSPAWVLYRSDANGDNIRQLSYNNENEYEPSVLNDGRIVFCRWEYTNRSEIYYHMLWTTRPDGTGVAAYYGADTVSPFMISEATAIPGTNRSVATATAHHSFTTGTLLVIDPSKGENGEAPLTHLTPEIPYPESQGRPRITFSHPYPITDKLFLASRAEYPISDFQGTLSPPNKRAIYLLDAFGGQERIYADPSVASFSPIPICQRKRPAVLPSMLPETPKGNQATVFVQNVYLTRNDPDGLIKPGSIKAIRVNAIGAQPRAKRSALHPLVGVEIPKKVLGTVPVNADGSAFFKVPAGVSLQLQTLDANGMAIMTERSFFYMQPGELRSCTGCHEKPGAVPSFLASIRKRQPLALTPPSGPKYPGGLSYARTVQPVLDRYCISCHGLDKTEKKVNLIHQAPRGWRAAVPSALISRGKHYIGYLKYTRSEASNNSRPYDYFAHANPVSHMLLKNHGKTNMDRQSRQRIFDWMDLNAQVYGDLFPNKVDHRLIDPAALKALRAYIASILGEKIANQPGRSLINVAQVDESRILMAPLARSAGGWGQMKPQWNSRTDAGYLKMLKMVNRCLVSIVNENTAGWRPSLAQGAGEQWVIEARKAYRDSVKHKK